MPHEPDRQLEIGDELDDFGEWMRSLPAHPFRAGSPTVRELERREYERRLEPLDDPASGVGECAVTGAALGRG